MEKEAAVLVEKENLLGCWGLGKAGAREHLSVAAVQGERSPTQDPAQEQGLKVFVMLTVPPPHTPPHSPCESS